MSQDETMRLVPVEPEGVKVDGFDLWQFGAYAYKIACGQGLTMPYAINAAYRAMVAKSGEALSTPSKDEVGGEGGEPGFRALAAFTAFHGDTAVGLAWGSMSHADKASWFRVANALYATPPADALRVAVEALERIDAATPGSTNSNSAESAFSWTHAVAATALAALKAVGVK
jgi:hypothetical protein